jgi:hypothetical protein
MRRTVNEVYRLCQKSTEGAGAPAGLDVETARSATWLSARGLPALDDLADELGLLADKRVCCFEHLPSDDRMDASQKAGTLIAPLLVERLVGALDGGSSSLEVGGLSSPLYLLPVAAAYARDGLCFDLVLHASGGERFRIVVSDESDLRVEAPTRAGLDVLSGGARVDVVARCTRDGDAVGQHHPREGARVLLDAEDVMRAQRESLTRGIEVEDGTWHRLAAYAATVLVPATDASRRGAGALGSDNE